MSYIKENINLKIDKVSIRRPLQEDINFISQLWQDERTMADVGGTVDYSPSQMKEWFNRIMDKNNISDNFFIIFADSEFAGEISFHRYSVDDNTADFNIKILNNLRGNGYSSKAMQCFFYYVFEIIKLNALYDELYSDNKRGINALGKMGFKIISENENTVKMKLTREDYLLVLRDDTFCQYFYTSTPFLLLL